MYAKREEAGMRLILWLMTVSIGAYAIGAAANKDLFLIAVGVVYGFFWTMELLEG